MGGDTDACGAAMKMYEYHEYKVDTQRWTKWPKALIMTHEWSTDGNDRRLEQRRYVPDYAQEVEDLKAQNAKLRELVQDMYGCSDSCTHCRHWNQGDGFYCSLGVGWKARRMRELGIEVDG